jgi:FRG domain
MKLPAYALLQMSDQDNNRIALEMQDRVRWTMVHEGDGSTGKAKLVRADHPRILYRGQTKQYDPSLPTIARGFPTGAYAISDLPDTDRARLLHGLALNCWFQAEIERHPMISWTKKHNVAFDVTAIAKHYGIPTGYMDVSESFQVSAFFATCWFDRKANEWKPMTDGEGVMFRLDARAIQDRTQPISYQPFPRPTAQWGWTTELLLGEDFLFAPSLQSFTFDHDRNVGEEILRRFDGGAKIIPPDPTAEVALQMSEGKEIPSCFVDEVEVDLLGDQGGFTTTEFKAARRTLTDVLGVDVVERANAGFSADQLRRAKIDWDACNADFWQGVGFQIVRTRPNGVS